MEQAVTSLQATIKQQEAELAEFQVGYPINFQVSNGYRLEWPRK